VEPAAIGDHGIASELAQQVELDRLLRHQRGLALRKDQHPGGELDALRDRGETGEQHERLEEALDAATR
jgi:hypothetical protein